MATNNDNTEHENKDNDPTVVLDEYLQYGKYQAIRVLGFGFLLGFFSAFSHGHLMFITLDPPDDWYCEEPNTVTCNKELEGFDSICDGGNVVFNESNPNYFYSLLVENHWMCNTKYLGPSIMSANIAGGIINALFFGYLSDIYGRKFLFTFTNALFIVLRLITYQLSNYYTIFLIMNIIANSYYPIGLRISALLLTEICDAKGRTQKYTMGWVSWVAGMTLLPYIAKWIGSWYPFAMLSTCVNIIFLLFHPFLTESPRWLISEKRFGEAATIVNNIRKVNGLKEVEGLDSELERLFKNEKKEGKSKFATILPIFKNFVIFRVIALMSIIWAVNDYFYIAGSLNAENLHGDLWLNFALVALTELPAAFVGQFLMDRLGRRWVHVGCMVFSTLPIMICIFLVGTHDQAVVVLSIIFKLVSNVGWFIMWVQCFEIIPTNLRSSGLTICSIVAKFLVMTGPFVVDLGKEDPRYPFIVFTIVGSVGIVLTSLVPETKGHAMAESEEDTVKLIRKFKFLQWKTWETTI